jgi:hypothetical protein
MFIYCNKIETEDEKKSWSPGNWKWEERINYRNRLQCCIMSSATLKNLLQTFKCVWGRKWERERERESERYIEREREGKSEREIELNAPDF